MSSCEKCGGTFRGRSHTPSELVFMVVCIVVIVGAVAVVCDPSVDLLIVPPLYIASNLAAYCLGRLA